MPDNTPHEIMETFFGNPAEKLRRPVRGTENDPRVELLIGLVLDLFLEVEALRATMLSTGAGAAGKDSAYGRAYRDTAYLTHNSCGLSSGEEKLFALFYHAGGMGRAWRESLMLRRPAPL